jgi:hypothetical protein
MKTRLLTVLLTSALACPLSIFAQLQGGRVVENRETFRSH